MGHNVIQLHTMPLEVLDFDKIIERIPTETDLKKKKRIRSFLFKHKQRAEFRKIVEMADIYFSIL